MAPEEPRARRLHPSSLLFEASRHLGALLSMAFAVFFLAARAQEAWYLTALLPPFLSALVRALTFRYLLGADNLVLRSGLLVRRVRHVPYGRIQNVDTLQGPMHRLLGVVEVRLETGAGQEPEAVLRVISTGQLEELRERIFSGRTEPQALQAGEPQPEPFFRMGASDILLFGLLSQRGLIVLGGVLVALNELEPWEALGERFDPRATARGPGRVPAGGPDPGALRAALPAAPAGAGGPVGLRDAAGLPHRAPR
jgi:putative membrane protein